MTGLVITGWSAVSSAGIGVEAHVRRLAGVPLTAAAVAPGVAVGGLCEEPLPSPDGHALPGFDVRAELGRKGTSWYDRSTALAVVSCREALREAGVTPGDGAATRVGVALGTTLGSFKSTSDYTRETLVQDRPYWVNPTLFPTTVMNCAAGQVAIRLGLKGVNATIAGGALAFLNAVRYASRIIGRGYADMMLTGAVEEYTPHRAWAGHLSGATAAVPTGEAAGVFVLAADRAVGTGSGNGAGHGSGHGSGNGSGPGSGAPGAGHGSTRTQARTQARILAVTTGYAPGGGSDAAAAGDALRRCVERCVRQAAIDPASITAAYTGESADADTRELDPVARALGHTPDRVLTKKLFGECDAASGAVALAAMLAAARSDVGPAGGDGDSGRGGRGGRALITAIGADGAVGAAIVEPVVEPVVEPSTAPAAGEVRA